MKSCNSGSNGRVIRLEKRTESSSIIIAYGLDDIDLSAHKSFSIILRLTIEQREKP